MPKKISVAIVGAGPAGLFAAQALHRDAPDVAIDVIERLPVPFGLLRYGVPPDHQDIKALALDFERLFEVGDVRLFADVEVGKSISLDDLRRHYDAVIMATGFPKDRRLGIPGENLHGGIGAGRFLRWLNEHPDEARTQPRLGASVAIIGLGDTALETARILASGGERFHGSDISDRRLEALESAGVSQIYVISNKPADKSDFTLELLSEISRIPNARINVVSLDGASPPPPFDRLNALGDQNGLRCTISFLFDLHPVSISGRRRMDVLRLGHGDGASVDVEISVDSVITAIGFEGDHTMLSEVARDRAESALPVRIDKGLYAVGWLRRGGQGNFAHDRLDASQLASALRMDFPERSAAAGLSQSEARARLLEILVERPMTYEDWRRIDAAEIRMAGFGRSRQKIGERHHMRLAAGKLGG